MSFFNFNQFFILCHFGVWDTADDGSIIQLIGAHYIFHRHKLTSGGAEYLTGPGKVGADGKDIGERRGG